MQMILYQTILGGISLIDTNAMKRGRILEPKVLEQVAAKTGLILEKTGLLLSESFPIFGASPDAITSEYVIEVKCPTSNQSKERYISSTGTVGKKVFAQIQLQMAMANRTKGLLCVASADFEESGDVQIIQVDFDKNYTLQKISEAESFWKQFVFPRIARQYTQCDDYGFVLRAHHSII